jgi:quercetin dioxygenase-like cupin family protein
MSVESPMNSGNGVTCLTDEMGLHALDVFGPTVEFLTFADDDANQICVMRAFIPPGVTVPLHCHSDFEGFYIVSGSHQVLVPGAQGLQWCDAHAGDYVQVPGGELHAHRNVSTEPAIDLIVTTARMGRFFREVGRPLPAAPPTLQELTHFTQLAADYGYRLGTPEENAAVGIELPAFTG